ncbi:NAD(P)/FAD-dependent oxidoreductase [Paenibacillus sp. FA6]|uniref:NAD(P)/FAD-dependent oxidoreductase n=1 Tax=Paenibacillus sp. FA6 TaxID=3413029 RepID=UPI003F655BDF
MKQIMDAVVIGGGIAGCSLAKQLADLGWRTVLLDRQSFPRHKTCGEFLSPESQEMLSKLGLDAVMESLQPQLISKARLIFEHGGSVEVPLPGTAWGISRYTLDSALHEAIIHAGANVRTGVTVTSIKQNEEGYEVKMKRHGEVEVIQARTVYAAWGSHRHSNMFNEPYPLDSSKPSYVGIKSHYSGIQPESVTELYFVKGGYIGISPVENGYSNVAALLEKGVVKGAGTTIPVILESASKENHQLVERMKHAVPVEGTQVSIAPVHLSHHPLAWHVIPHLGDAAVVIPPLCGDGMSIALRSSILCCAFADRYLRGEISLSRWQEEYTQAIEHEFSGLIRRGRIAHVLCSMPRITRWFPTVVRICPPIGKYLVKATRLKSYT